MGRYLKLRTQSKNGYLIQILLLIINDYIMKYIRIVICFLIFVCLGCQNKNKSTTRIDIKYQNYAIETVAGPKWDEVINGVHPEFLVESSITNEKVCDSIICLVSNLKPMKPGTIPSEFKPYMQCIIHFADGHSSVFLLGEHYNTLDSVAMMDNDTLVQMICKYSGYNHPKMY